MFERFGEMGDWRELDTLAKNLWKEGDKESLKTLCEENGLDIRDIEDAAADEVELYITPTMAAQGRLAVEEKETKIPKDAARVIYGMARTMATDPHEAQIFLKKGKRLDDVWKKLKAMAKGNNGCACGTDRDLQKLIREVYA